MARVNPYLNFSGNCEDASDFYQRLFGGELETAGSRRCRRPKLRSRSIPT